MPNRQHEFFSVDLRRTDGLVELQVAALKATANAVVITDHTGTVIWVNSAFEQLTGYTHEEIVGQNTRVLKSGLNPRALYEDMWRTILSERTWRGELINRRKDGSLYDEEMTITPVHASRGEISHYIAIKQNVSERKQVEARLLSLTERVSLATAVAKMGVWELDLASNAFTWDATMFEIYGFSPVALIPYEKWSAAVHSGDLPAVEATLQKAIDEKGQGSAEFRIILADGTVKDVFAVGRVVLDEHANVKRVLGTAQDITERAKTEERLRLWSRVLDQSAEGIFICDPQERILLVNRAFEQLTGFLADEAVGKTPRILQSGRQDQTFYADMWKSVLETGTWRGEVWNRRKSGELFVEWLSISAVCDRKGAVTHYVGIFSDITARKKAEERMVHLAHYDALTDLPNRVLLMDRLNQLTKAAQRRKTKVGVVFIDLDRFKEVNDSLGHDAGDLLLQTLAKRLSRAVRDEDTVARLGGDEFVVVFQGLHDVQDVVVLAQKLLSCMVKPVTLNGFELTVTASMGISLYPDDAANGQEMIRNADAAMYQAKGTGRNAYQFYTSDLNQRALEMLSMENALRRAIERQEFVLHYQPQVNAISGSVVGAEALIRWNHPDLGLVMPGKFISIAEERGLIVPIGSWVIEEAARQAAIWQNSGRLSFPIAVNVSAAQFRQKDFVEQLATTVRKHGITPRRFELELTESIIMRDVEVTLKTLESLHEMGFQLSIDDFGTGYSSLRYLQRFPIDKIKIDQSFVRDEAALGIITTIIGLARSLKLKVIAEGVETNEQLEMLREQCCHEAQGFLFGPGLVPGDFERLVRDWKPEFRDPVISR